MTREEAIEIEIKSARSWEPFSKIPAMHIRAAAAGTIDCYVALGMLKLDEPKSLDARLAAALGWPEHGRSHGELTVALDAAGLKIVEK